MFARFTEPNFSWKLGSVANFSSGLQLFGVIQEFVADRLADKAGEPGVALLQPAAWRDAVGLVVDAVRIELVQVRKDRDLHEFGMQGGYAVDRMRADEGEIAHPHPAVAALVDQRDRPDFGVGEVLFPAGLKQNLGIDRVDQLHVTRQQPLEERDRPGFESFRQERVVGVGNRAADDIEGLLEIHAVNVTEQARQLGNRNGGVGVIQLDRHLVRQRREIVILLQVTAQDVLKRGGGEEEFLAKAQLLSGGRRVCRIEHARQTFRLVAFAQSTDMVAGIEGVEQDRVDRLGRPETQRVDAFAAPADHRCVEGSGDDALCRLPDIARLAFGVVGDVDGAAVADFIGAFAAFEFPGVAMREPAFRQFHLPAVGKLLTEEAVDITDAVAIGRHFDRCHAFHETGREAPEAAVAESSIRLEAGDHVDIDAQGGERIAHLLHQAHVRDGIAHQAADQELKRQVVNALVACRVDLARRLHPFVNNAVANDEDSRRQPVMRLGNFCILADAVSQAFDDFFG